MIENFKCFLFLPIILWDEPEKETQLFWNPISSRQHQSGVNVKVLCTWFNPKTLSDHLLCPQSSYKIRILQALKREFDESETGWKVRNYSLDSPFCQKYILL